MVMKTVRHSLLLLLLTFCSAQTVQAQTSGSRIVMRWGINLTTRLDTLSPVRCDTFGINRSWFRLETDSAYNCPYFPVVYEGMLLFADSAGNVQNIVVKSYDYEYFNGAVTRSAHNGNRELLWAGLAIAKHKVGDRGKITRVECVDLAGRKTTVHIPPFYFVKYRQL
jgi:hypothetical protein